MKILEINKFHYLKGGSERYYFGLADELKRQGHEVIFFSMLDNRNKESKYKKYFIKNIDLHKFSLINIIKFFYNYEAVRNLKKLIKDEKPDIAHLHNIAHQLSPAIINVLKKNNIPIVQTLHDYKLICPNAQLYNQGKICERCNRGEYYQCFLNKCMHNSRAKSFLGMLEAYLHNTILKTYDQIDLFLAPSQFMKDTCVRFGIEEKRIKTIYNFVPEDFLEGNFLSKEEKNEEDYLLYFGRLSEEKGVSLLLDALILSKEKIKLKIVGTGPNLKNLKKQIQKHNLVKKVELLGYKSGDELKKIILNSRAIVIPSLWPENMPFSLLEALSSGVPAIVSEVGGMPEIIKENINGFIFKRGDSSDLAKKINKLLKTDSEKLKKEAKKSVISLNLKEHTERILGLYKDLI